MVALGATWAGWASPLPQSDQALGLCVVGVDRRAAKPSRTGWALGDLLATAGDGLSDGGWEGNRGVVALPPTIRFPWLSARGDHPTYRNQYAPSPSARPGCGAEPRGFSPHGADEHGSKPPPRPHTKPGPNSG